MKYSKVLDLADKAIADRKTSELLRLCENLIGCGDESIRPSGYMLKGMAYEIGGDGIEQDFEKAVSYYRQSAYLQPNAMVCVFMARATMKKGQESYPSALRYLKEAQSMKYVPELDIAFGMCYEGSPEPNYRLAKRHYLKAAMHGRFHGFFGYSSVSRKMGQRARACAADFLRVLIGPLLFLVFGRSASNGI